MKKIISLYIFGLLFFSVVHGQSDIQADIKNREKWQITWQNVRKYYEENWAYTVYNPADLKISQHRLQPWHGRLYTSCQI